MHRTKTISGLLCLALALGLVVGCGGQAKKDEKKEQARQQEWQAIEQAKTELTDLRNERDELAARLKNGGEEKGEEAKAAETPAKGEEAGSEQGAGAEGGQAMTPEQEKARLEELRNKVMSLEDSLRERIVTFINSNPPVEGEPLTDLQLAAIRMKSSEDMLMAKEYIDKGGEYQRAINIYDDALKVDPDNQELKAALEKAQEMRYMTKDRFSQVKKGMSADEVRGVLGQPNLRNVREYEKQGATAWFYPKDKSGAAAAVWFRKARKTGALEVYKADFDALKGHGEAQPEEPGK